MCLPRFIPEAMIEAKLQTLGLRNFQWFPRTGTELPVEPRTDPLYTDDWNRVLVADYIGRGAEFEEKKIWSWMVIRPKVPA